MDYPPLKPTGLTLTNSGGFPKLDWNANGESDIDVYTVYRQRDGIDSSFTLVATVSSTTYTDNSVQIGTGYYIRYKIEAVDNASQYSPFSKEVKTKGRSIEKSLVHDRIPTEFALGRNWPNPFNPTTTIRFSLPEWSFVELKIYSLVGREIGTLANGNEDAGYQSVIWDGTDSYGNPVSSGMYFYRLDAVSYESDKEFHQTRKMVLLR